ncbi:MAG: fumarylacetoacetate hydrolase family protein [Alphaproteobacteria bacterium]|nr:fumarylacetoacetate hydrolase family protein [Alphaproteobacteria bacterium]
MKLFRFGQPDSEKPGIVLADGRHVDASGFGADYDEAFFAGGGLGRLAAWAAGDGANAPEVGLDIRFGPAVARPSKLVCIGLNFTDHAEEAGMAIPTEPVVFLKSTTALSGVNDDLVLPRGENHKTDWEIELAFVIGKRASYVDEGKAIDCIAGYAPLNDYSERYLQLECGGQWVKGKSFDGFAPFGPYLVTADDVPDPENLRLWLKVNGETKQEGSTSRYIFSLATVVSYVSSCMTLLPGDIVTTGTPPGVGLGLKPPQFLQAGDVVEWGIDGLGSAKQTVIEG